MYVSQKMKIVNKCLLPLSIVMILAYAVYKYLKYCKSRTEILYRTLDKQKKMFDCSIAWLKDSCTENAILERIGKNKTVAIYGMGVLGEALYEYMNRYGVSISYGIDRIIPGNKYGMEILSPDIDELPDVDVIIVTVIDSFDGIKEMLAKKSNASIVSLRDIVYGNK